MANRELIFRAVRRLMDEVSWLRLDDNDQPVGSAISFVTKARKVKLFSDVPTEQQPACFQAEHGDQIAQKSNLPYRELLETNWIIYQDRANQGFEGAIENNLIIDAIKEAFAPKPRDPGFRDKRNTLNGLVYHCYIEGRIFKDPGDIDGQGMIVIPIKLLVP